MRQFGNTTRNAAICRDCEGTGVIIIPGENLGHGNYAEETRKTCATCEGSGMVMVTRTVHVTITPKPVNPEVCPAT